MSWKKRVDGVSGTIACSQKFRGCPPKPKGKESMQKNQPVGRLVLEPSTKDTLAT